MLITKRKMIAGLRKNGFFKSQLQRSRGGHTYSKQKEDGHYIMMTVPRHSRHTVIITGSEKHNGLWCRSSGFIVRFGKHPVMPDNHDAYSWAVELSKIIK